MTTVDRSTPPVRTHAAERRWVGQSIRRVEDPRFLRGRGGYIADRITPGTLHAAVLRSPYPHARITGFDVAAAQEAPGVHAVMVSTLTSGSVLLFCGWQLWSLSREERRDRAGEDRPGRAPRHPVGQHREDER